MKPALFLAALLLTKLVIAQDDARFSSGVITVYHHVATDTPPSTSISPQDFRAHLNYLQENDFNVMSLTDMVEVLREGQEVPDKSLAITFDDGYISIYETAFPMLQEFGMPFTLFVSTEPVNNRQPGYMTWAEIREMSDAGVTIANHMVTHPHMLERAARESREQWLARLEAELLAAEATITEETGQSHRYLAYPYGEYDPAIKALLREQDFTGFAQNSGALGWHSDFLELPRYPLASIYANLETARTKMESLAFNVTQLEPASPVTTDASPRVTLQFDTNRFDIGHLNCFANSQPITMTWEDRSAGIVTLEPQMEFNTRRWRYICTARANNSSRYFWHSVQWINTSFPE